MLLSCDFFPGDKHLLSTTLEGGVNILSIDDKMHTVKHEEIETHRKDNTIYCCKTVKSSFDQEGVFLLGSENKIVK
jgi:hypothetical protein